MGNTIVKETVYVPRVKHSNEKYVPSMPREDDNNYLAHFYSRGGVPHDNRYDQEKMTSDNRQMDSHTVDRVRGGLIKNPKTYQSVARRAQIYTANRENND